MKLSNRLQLLVPALVIAIAVFWLLSVFGSLPLAIVDLAGRAWPVILVALGLALLLGRRVRYANVIIAIVCVVLVGGMITVAYSQQSAKFSQAYHVLVYKPDQPLPPDVNNVRISVTTLITEVDVVPADHESRVLTVDFTGSQESRADLEYTQDGNTGVYTFTESQTNSIPMLETIGKGKLTLTLPAGVTIDQLTINGREGDLNFDSSSNAISALSISMGTGNLNVKLAAQPGLSGDLKTGGGDVTLQIPKSISAQIELKGGGAANPDFNPADYFITRDNFLKPQRDPNNPQMQLSVDTAGKISVQ